MHAATYYARRLEIVENGGFVINRDFADRLLGVVVPGVLVIDESSEHFGGGLDLVVRSQMASLVDNDERQVVVFLGNTIVGAVVANPDLNVCVIEALLSVPSKLREPCLSAW